MHPGYWLIYYAWMWVQLCQGDGGPFTRAASTPP